MAFEKKPGQGALFKNTRKDKDSHPDYTGSINIGGTEWRLSAWLKYGKQGKFFSIAASEPYQKEQRREQPKGRIEDMDSDIPF